MARKSKYADVIDKLPKLFGLEVPYQERVDETKKKFIEEGQSLDATALVTRYGELREIKDGLENELHEVNLGLEALGQMITNEFDAKGLTSLKLSNGALLQSYSEPHSVVIDKVAFRNWCLKNGYENDLSMPWMKTNAIVKERLLENEPPPDGVEAIARPKIVYKGA